MKNNVIEHQCFDMDYKIKNTVMRVISLLPYEQTVEQFVQSSVKHYVEHLKKSGVISKTIHFPNL